MAITRPGKTVRCASCGATADKKQGANNWRMCDRCMVAYCSDCYRSVLKSKSFCTDHNPWGKWLMGGGTFADMTFK